MKRKAWRVFGWLVRPVQFAVLCGLVSLGLSAAFDWAQGWDLGWSFAVPALTILILEGANRLWERWSRRRAVAPIPAGPSMEDVRRAYERIEEAKRTVLCSAEHEDAVRTTLDRENVAGMFKIQVSEMLPENSVVVMDEAAIRASFRQNLTNPMTFEHPSSWFEMDRASLLRDIRNGRAQAWTLPEAERSDPKEGLS